MTTQRPASTLSVSDRAARRVALHLVNTTAEAISTAYHAMPDDYWSQHEYLAKAAVRAVLHGLGTRAGSWVHMTDFAVFSSWVDQLAPAEVTEDAETHGTSGGVELTDDLMDVLVDEAETGYDVNRLRRRPTHGVHVEPLNDKLRRETEEVNQE